MKTGRYNISKLFASPEIEQIVIPELQRDYVWGERNVRGLLTSILNNYKLKEEVTLDITNPSGEGLSEDIRKYLTEEYMRLRYNTRVGFIYAYHDKTLFGQYYLIDGQQRLTTIYLLLLALYSRSAHKDQFRNRYFVTSMPKIDYKVRDVAHNFLVDFIEFELTNTDSGRTFRDSSLYYIEYDRDITSKSIYNNYYRVIVPMLKDCDVDSLIDYVENYIEFNYFDTNMSEQGEKLYLYMNSRGEALSAQEKIKSIIVGRSAAKLDAGREWENWQNFFWRLRGMDENADRGFFEFIKWAVILHYFDTHKDESVSPKVFEEYVRLDNSETAAAQTVLLSLYIADHEDFDFKWLSRVKSAVDFMYDDKGFYESYGLAVTSWFSAPKTIIDYLPLLGTLYYLLTDDSCDHVRNNVLRAGMYLKNMKSDYLLRRSPSEGALRGLQFIAWIRDSNIADVRRLGDALEYEYRSVFRKEDMRLKYFREDFDATPDEIGKWELFSWDITNRQESNHDLNKFLRGNHDFVFRLVEYPGSEPSNVLNHFYNKIFLRRKDDDLCKELMALGDIAVSDEGGSSNLGSYMGRYCLLHSNDDDTYWYQFMNHPEKQKVHVEMIREYLNGNQMAPPAYDLEIHKTLYDEMANSLDYMSKRFFLWREEAGERIRVVLLKMVQASPSNSRELCVQYLHRLIPQSEMNDYRTCFVTFDDYCLKFTYEWREHGGVWICNVCSATSESLPDKVVAEFKEKHSRYAWRDCDGNSLKAELYHEDMSTPYFEGADKVKIFYDQVLQSRSDGKDL